MGKKSSFVQIQCDRRDRKLSGARDGQPQHANVHAGQDSDSKTCFPSSVPSVQQSTGKINEKGTIHQ